MKRRARLIRFAALAATFSIAVQVGARPGGGSSFSSGSSHSSSSSSSSSSSHSSSSSSSSHSSSSSSSGSGSSSSASNESFRLRGGRERAAVWRPGELSLFGVPPARPARTRVTGNDEAEVNLILFGVVIVFGLIASIFLGGGVLLAASIARRPKGWSTRAAALAEAPAFRRRDLDAIRALDPDFSVVLFEDFLYALYAEAHTARGAGRFELLAPYLQPQARAGLAALGAGPVSTVVVGAMRFVACAVSPDGGARVSVEFEANYTQGGQSYYAAERWTRARGAGARSRPPDKIRVFACPSCGAPLDKIVGSSCEYCHRIVDSGVFDWVVERIDVVEREARPPMLTGTTEEAGTSLPTLYDPALAAARAALRQRDPTFDEQGLFRRIGSIFATMQSAWSSLAWENARPFLSDNLWQSQSYWLAAYRASGLRNLTDNARITGLELVRIAFDRWYDAVTVRLHATGLDYTLRDADGAVVGGNRSSERAYTEYWTLIRTPDAQSRAHAESACPSCGAPLSINMAAECTHCRAKVNSGRFDWVLSRIEQDEVYSG